MNTAAIIVTYNRKALLQRCIEALINQTYRIQAIIIIDNASTDSTESWFQNCIYRANSNIIYIRLSENTGGAGGFNAGLKYTQDNGYDWTWIMDDDAEPTPTALEELLKHPLDTNCLYGSIAVMGEQTSWEMTLITHENSKNVNLLNEIPDFSQVLFLPFLGLLISKETLDTIGLPDKDFFISGDDLEFCLRARKMGIGTFIKGRSVIHHPLAQISNLRLILITIKILEVSPWKNYYNIRNKIIISKKYYGLSLLTSTLPGILIRILYYLVKRPNKMSQLYASTAAIIDGVLGIKGKRHTWWRIKQ